ncbi:exodeoxyribonuclease VII small subunit [Hazenella sp. IB182357]|uniref:Exodeoxyribonuclease 7 small subunit n=1 Tax=Polycladospora coralii TaxID=2771432 RepID=A0A926NB14_9BACL|nr:exodeoxyribonuclease VII small subunit [Polycladospora coralii]MBD1373252.1 exodeoxyribonuclease VII small subunit [Polycladospora coralii]MBS7530910.1 exodeoxyribonuclease VII small subunit [Polycladospora coralii]
MSDKRDMNQLPFEQALERLENVVEHLEKGDTPLEEAIQLFDEGMKLAHACNKKLEWAEQKVELLVQENGEWKKEPFLSEEDAE